MRGNLIFYKNRFAKKREKFVRFAKIKKGFLHLIFRIQLYVNDADIYITDSVWKIIYVLDVY